MDIDHNNVKIKKFISFCKQERWNYYKKMEG